MATLNLTTNGKSYDVALSHKNNVVTIKTTCGDQVKEVGYFKSLILAHGPLRLVWRIVEAGAIAVSSEKGVDGKAVQKLRELSFSFWNELNK